ncbi:MAG: AzlC family ABC transporter permease [Xanthobacteraceae bacterium]
MTNAPRERPGAAYWSLAGLIEGARLGAPVMPGMALFGAAFGALAAQKGLTLLEAVLMTGVVYAGASQFVALEMWPEIATLGGIVTVGLVTATVNMRFILMTAALRPWFGSLPPWQSYPSLCTITDPGWLIAMHYYSKGGRDASILVGGGLAFWVLWVASCVPGYLLGALVSDQKSFGFDVIMPAFFVVMLVPLWQGTRRAIPWAVAGAVALAVAQLVPGWWFIMAGAIAGSIAGGFLDER